MEENDDVRTGIYVRVIQLANRVSGGYCCFVRRTCGRSEVRSQSVSQCLFAGVAAVDQGGAGGAGM